MSKPHIILDGYNYILRLSKLAEDDENALWNAREQLINRMIAFRGSKQIKMTIVFDGQDIKLIGKIARPAGIHILFSKSPQKADHIIISLIKKEKQPKNTTVVTSDKTLAFFVKGFGCQHWSVEEMQKKVEISQSDPDYENKYNFNMTEEELQEWMALFKGSKKK